MRAEEDKIEALDYWSLAVSLGHAEAEYHLCHAYADNEVSTHNPVQAVHHCKKAKLLYQEVKKPDEDDETILNQINGYLSQLEN